MCFWFLLACGAAGVAWGQAADDDDLPPAVLQHFPQLRKASPAAAAVKSGGARRGVGLEFRDPAEGAFTASLPAGWRIAGGTERVSRMEPHYVIRAESAGGGAQVFMDDPRLPIRQVPGFATDGMGWREGMMIPAAGGMRLLLERYRPGPQAAEEYVRGALCPNATDVRGGVIPGETQELMREFGPIAAAEGKQIRVDSGELSFKRGCPHPRSYFSSPTTSNHGLSPSPSMPLIPARAQILRRRFA